MAATFQAITGMTRAASTATTAGVGNPVVSTVEAGCATAFSILAVAIPLVGLAVIVILLALVYWPGRALFLRISLGKAKRDKPD